jgi:hypothetical protein
MPSEAYTRRFYGVSSAGKIVSRVVNWKAVPSTGRHLDMVGFRVQIPARLPGSSTQFQVLTVRRPPSLPSRVCVLSYRPFLFR